MTLQELMDTILASSSDDWHTISCWGADSGPAYRERFTFYDGWEGEKGILKAESHAVVAVYMPDVSITMATGLTRLEEFKEVWANQFPDPHASSSYVDVFYNNALVFRDQCVSVDGGRARLPLPNNAKALEVPSARRDFIRLVESFDGSRDEFDSYFKRAGFKVVDEPWPVF